MKNLKYGGIEYPHRLHQQQARDAESVGGL